MSSEFPTLYLNENINPELVKLLAQFNVNAVHTYDVGNEGANDEFQLEYASERGYVVVTHNRRHYRKLHNDWTNSGKKHAGIIVLKPSEPEYIADRIRRFFEQKYSHVQTSFCISPPP